MTTRYLRMAPVLATLVALFFSGAGGVQAQQKSTAEAIAEYRASLQDGNPADLNAARGEVLWKKPAGPKNASLEACDLGLGAGKVKGAVTQLPRYFADAGKVMDVESRLVHCMVTLQGMKREDFKASTAFSSEGQRATLIEDLVAYVYDASRDMTIAIPQNHAEEKRAFARGHEIFYFKGGPLRFFVRFVSQQRRSAHSPARLAESDQDRAGPRGVFAMASLPGQSGRRADHAMAGI